VLQIVVRRLDNALYHSSIISGQAQGYTQIKGLLTLSEPAVVEFNGELWVGVRGMDSRIYENHLTVGIGWSGWKELEGGMQTPSGPGSAASADILSWVVQGEDNGVYLNQSR
jgi:hypothetical protein